MASNDLFSSPLSAGVGNFSSNNQSALFGLVQEDPLPGQFGAATSEVPDLTRTADTLKRTGSVLAGQGGQALQMAQQGQLTGPQQAQLHQYQQGLTNQARQMYYNMGRTPDKDTSFIGQTADIDAKVNAMAQQQIQSTIALGLGELSSGSGFFGQSLGFDQAALQTLIQAGQAQVTQDQNFQKSLSDTFGAIGKMFGSLGGDAIGKSVSKAFGL